MRDHGWVDTSRGIRRIWAKGAVAPDSQGRPNHLKLQGTAVYANFHEHEEG